MLARLKAYFFAHPTSTWSIVLRTMREQFPLYRARFGVAAIFMAVTAGATAAMAWLMRDAVNGIFVDQQVMAIWVFGGLIIALSMVKGLSTFVQTLILQRIGNAIVASIQRRIIDKLLHLSPGYFAESNSNEVAHRMNNASRAPAALTNMIVTSVGSDLLTLILLVAVMAMQDLLMTGLALVITPAVIFGVTRLIEMLRNLSTEEAAGMVNVYSAARETSAGISVIKSFRMEDAMRTRAGNAIRGVELRRNAIARIMNLTAPLMESLGGVAIGIAMIYAGWQTIEAGKTPGEYMAFIAAFLLAYEPAKRLARLRLNVERSAKISQMVYDLLDTPEEPPDLPEATPLEAVTGQVALNEVTFSYSRKARVIKGVSLTAGAGEMIALVGPSGGGKTTLVNLIQRFYEPDSGEILIDGQNIRLATRASLRQHMAFVSQDAFLFDGSIYDNVLCGRLDASEDEVIDAVKAAYAWDFVAQLPQGIMTPVGEKGILLSTGQRQRLTIARAILRNAPILLLDEATSALDNESERMVQAALRRLMEGRTTIVIAHRLSTVRRADRIYVIENGKVAEEGTHDSLIKRKGVYARLHMGDAFDRYDEAVMEAAK